MPTNLLAGVLFVASTCLWGAALAAWFRIRAPTANAFGWIAAVMGVGGLVLAVEFAVDRLVFVLPVTIVVGMALPVLWFRFAVEYVGRDEFSSPRVIGLISVPVAVGVFVTALLFGSQLLPWFTLPAGDGATGAVAAVLTAMSLVQWFGLLYAGGLVLAGSGVVLWAFQRYGHLDSTTGVVLGTFGTVPWLSMLFGLQLEGVSVFALGGVVSIGLLVGGLTALALVGPFPLFARVPSAGNVGPRTVIEELADQVVVTDANGTIVDLNASARRTFEGTETAVGTGVEAFLGTSIPGLRTGEVLPLESKDGQVLFTPTVSALTDQHGQRLGYAVVLRDVTTGTTRRQILEVFTRVLRHNLRNDMNVVIGRADLIRSRSDDPAIVENTRTIRETAEALTRLSNKVRETEDILDLDVAGDWQTPLDPVVEEVFDAVANDLAAVSYDGPSVGVVVDAPPELVHLVLLNLIENAVEHHDGDRPSVEVVATFDPDESYPLRVTVADDGPGLPEVEQRTIERETETSLQHGSGVGLWIVRIAMTRMGGKLTFSGRDPRGTVVTLDFPNAARAESAASADEDVESTTSDARD